MPTTHSESRASVADNPAPGVPWGRFLVVYVVLLLVGAETFLISPLLPTIASTMQVSDSAAAMAVNGYVLTYAVTAPFLGVITDRVGRRRGILIGASLFALGNVLAATAPTLGMLICARAVGGLGAALVGPAIWAYIADMAPDHARGKAMGMGMAAFSTGQVVGIPVGGLIASVASWRASFGVIALVAALAVPALHLSVWRTQPSPQAPASAGAVLRRTFSLWRMPAPAQALVVTFLLQAASLGSYSFLGVVLHSRYDLPVGALGLLGILVGLGSVLGSVLGGRIGDRARRRGHGDASRLVLWCLLLGCGVLLAAASPTMWLSLAGVVLWFFASGAFVTDQQTLLTNALPQHRAAASSWNTSTMHLGTAIGVWIIGAFTAIPTGVTVIGGGLAAAAAVAAVLLQLRLRQPAVSGQP